MRKLARNMVLYSVLLMLLGATLASCASMDPRVDTAGVSEVSPDAKYTLIRYGGNYGSDVKVAAFLDSEGDAVEFEPYTSDFNFTKITGLSAKEAFDAAESFLKGRNAYRTSQLRKIMADGKLVGYEIRPLYLPFQYGIQDVLQISYRVVENRLQIFVRLDHGVEQQIEGRGFPE